MTQTGVAVDDADILVGLQRIVDLGEDPSPALLAIGQLLRDSSARRFETETDPTG